MADTANKKALYLILFLHQTTTATTEELPRTSCILFFFYIKPQPPGLGGLSRSVVSYSFSTSNHNKPAVFHFLHRVVSYSFSTSNHNLGFLSAWFIGCYLLVDHIKSFRRIPKKWLLMNFWQDTKKVLIVAVILIWLSQLFHKNSWCHWTACRLQTKCWPCRLPVSRIALSWYAHPYSLLKDNVWHTRKTASSRIRLFRVTFWIELHPSFPFWSWQANQKIQKAT